MELTKVNNHYEDNEGNKYKIIPALFKINKDGTEERQYGSITLDTDGEKTGWLDLKELGERNNRLLHSNFEVTDEAWLKTDGVI